MTDQEAPIRVGLLGCGAVAQVAHMPAYQRVRGADLVAIADSDGLKRRALAERARVRHSVATLDDLLAIDELDAIDICLPSDLHRDAVLRCLAAGKHVLCEKPLGLGPDDIKAVIDARSGGDRVVVVGMNNRYRDDSILLKQFIEDGALGEIFYARAGWLKRRDRIRPGEWQYQFQRSGGGVLMDLGIQLLDLVLWLCGYPDPHRVDASFYSHMPDIEVEDSAVVTLHCADRLTITLETSWHFLLDRDHHFVNLFGSTGSGLLNPIRIFQHMHGNLVNVTPQAQRRMGNIYMESYEREIAFFAEVVSGRAEAPPLDEQLVLAWVIEAIQRSAREEREVRIGE